MGKRERCESLRERVHTASNLARSCMDFQSVMVCNLERDWSHAWTGRVVRITFALG